ncbi:MAG: carbohydrate kinase [Paraprevotella sp.]|nr:carbohydrate kinase [Paraprevotella sp.]
MENKRKVIGTGETILDIVFRGEQPVAAVPGGSAYNSVISMSRAGLPVWFVGETGDDRVGRQIIKFLQDNGVHTEYMFARPGGRASVSLAYLDEKNDADYLFFKQQPRPFEQNGSPAIAADDVVVFGSYYAINADTRDQVRALLNKARDHNAILYYDVNFRSSHRHELDELMPAIRENFRLSDVVRGSSEDCRIMFGTDDIGRIYREQIAPFCPSFIYTDGNRPTTVCTPAGTYEIPVRPVESVSTVGAGDNFNAGFIYGLFRERITKGTLGTLSEEQWNILINYGQCFATNVCASLNNSIDIELGKRLNEELGLNKA